MDNTTNNNINTNNSNEIETMMEGVKTVFTATQTHMASMTIGTRIPVKDMAEVIGKQINIEPQNVLPFVHYMCKNGSLGYITPGRNGGWVRSADGKRPLKTTKIKMSSTDTSQNTTTSTEDADNSSV